MDLVMQIDIVGSQVTRVSFGYEVILIVHPAASITLGDAFSLARPTGEQLMADRPQLAVGMVDDLAGLFETIVTDAFVDDDSGLHLAFSNGTSMTAPASAVAEAWALDLNGSPSKIVCIVGGALEVWD